MSTHFTRTAEPDTICAYHLRNKLVSLTIFKVFAAVLIFLVSMGTALYILRRKNALNQGETAGVGEAVASGIFLGAAFFHMLPDSIRTFTQLYPHIHFPVPELICVGAFLLLLFLERISLSHKEHSTASHVPIVLAFTLIIHALSEGAALGLETAYAETSMLFIAILAHKGSVSFGLCILLIRYAVPYRQMLFILFVFSIMTPLGIFFGELISSSDNNQLLGAAFSSFAAGTFLYISTLHHVHFHNHSHDDSQGLFEFFCLALGVVIMAVIAIWA